MKIDMKKSGIIDAHKRKNRSCNLSKNSFKIMAVMDRELINRGK